MHINQKIVQAAFNHLNTQYKKSIHKTILAVSILEDDLELTIIETSEQQEKYKVLGKLIWPIGVGQILDQIILSQVISYIAEQEEYQTIFFQEVVAAYELTQEIEQIKNEKIRNYLRELKRQVQCMKYILSNFDEMPIEIIEGQDKLFIDRTYFEEEILEELALRANVKEAFSNLIQKMNEQYKKWGIDEVLLVGRSVQIPYIKQVIKNELMFRGVAKKKIFESQEVQPIYMLLDDLLMLSHKIEEHKEVGKYPKIKYKGLIYEYRKKEINRRTQKEEITLQCGKAEEKVSADKEKYFKFLEAETKQKSILDFQVAILDEKKAYEILGDSEQVNKILKLAEMNIEGQFLRYCTNIKELIKVVREQPIRYILIVASSKQYGVYSSRIQEKFRDVQLLNINILEEEQLEIKQEKAQIQSDSTKSKEIPKKERQVHVTYEVEFKNGYYAYFTDYYQVDKIDKTKGIVEEKYIKQLKSKDQLIVVNNQTTYSRNIMMYIIEATINSDQVSKAIKKDYQLFIQWKDELETYIDHHGYDVEQLAILLEQGRVYLTPQAIAQWRPDGRTIAPQSKKSLDVLIDIIGSDSLKSQKARAHEASTNIRSLYTHIKRLIEEIVINESVQRRYYTGVQRVAYEIVKDFRSYSKIVEVKSVKKVNKKMKISQVNTILKS